MFHKFFNKMFIFPGGIHKLSFPTAIQIQFVTKLSDVKKKKRQTYFITASLWRLLLLLSLLPYVATISVLAHWNQCLPPALVLAPFQSTSHLPATWLKERISLQPFPHMLNVPSLHLLSGQNRDQHSAKMPLFLLLIFHLATEAPAFSLSLNLSSFFPFPTHGTWCPSTRNGLCVFACLAPSPAPKPCPSEGSSQATYSKGDLPLALHILFICSPYFSLIAFITICNWIFIG